MSTKEKKERLSQIKESLSRGLFRGGFVKNIGSVFFRYKDCGCVQRDVVYYGSLRYGLEFELLSLDGQYFCGSKEHAQALEEHYGGKAYPSEFCNVAKNPRELWIWELPILPENRSNGENKKPLDYNEAVSVLFDVV